MLVNEVFKQYQAPAEVPVAEKNFETPTLYPFYLLSHFETTNRLFDSFFKLKGTDLIG